MEYGNLEFNFNWLSSLGIVAKWYLIGVLVYLCLISFIYMFKPKNQPSMKLGNLVVQALFSWVSIIITLWITYQYGLLAYIKNKRNINGLKNARGFMFDYAEYYSARIALDNVVKDISKEEKEMKEFKIFMEDSNERLNRIHSDIINKYGKDYNVKYRSEIDNIVEAGKKSIERLNRSLHEQNK